MSEPAEEPTSTAGPDGPGDQTVEQRQDNQSQAGDRETDGGQVSEGPSSFANAETTVGGADSVPDTPDVNPGTSAPIRGPQDDG